MEESMNLLGSISLVDVHVNNDLTEARSKFPSEKKVKCEIQHAEICFDGDDVKKATLKINEVGCSGKCGSNNGLLLLLATNKHDFTRQLTLLIKKIFEIRLDYDIKKYH